jgi:hypothetical protein
MGGIEIFVPREWQVVMNSMPFLGGMENKTVTDQSTDTAAKKLIVKGMAIMGGVEIKN